MRANDSSIADDNLLTIILKITPTPRELRHRIGCKITVQINNYLQQNVIVELLFVRGIGR